MEKIKTPGGVSAFTGGPFMTNCFLVRAPGGCILIDAPEGCSKAFAGEKISLLVLTHGHFDHYLDAAEVVRRHGCGVAMHPVTETIVADRTLPRRLGIDVDPEPVAATMTLREGTADLLGINYGILEVPGHCPGSICLHDPSAGLLFGGDVLFAGGVGRWDLPGGDRETLISGIREKILALADSTMVLPGHGCETTVGDERNGNPYLR
jgi:glyoxylase-like metal-dependent hydrolase (beta-lactamase superfamily II)